MPTTLTHISALPHLHDHADLEAIEIPMTSEDRCRVRRRLTAPDGREFALELPTGTVLSTKQAIHLEGNKVYVVEAAPEEVLVIHPRSLTEAAFTGHLIGNLHRDVDLVDESIIALWNEPLEARLNKAGLPYERSLRPFNGRPPGEHSH